MSKIQLFTRLCLINPGSIELNELFVSDLSSDVEGCAIFIKSTSVSAFLRNSVLQKCVTSVKEYGGAISVCGSKTVFLTNICFNNNQCYGSPDLILYGSDIYFLSLSEVNRTSFLRSTSTVSCTNWFRSTELTLHSINSSSMEAKARASGICFGSVSKNIPITKFLLIDNCTSAKYVIEICSEINLKQILEHFIVTSSSATTAVLSCMNSAYSIGFLNSVFSGISAGHWTDSKYLSISFENSFFQDCPSRGSYSSIGEATKWEHAWPNNSKCRREDSESGIFIHNLQKMKLPIVISICFINYL